MDWATVTPLVTAGVSTAGQIAAARQAGRQAQAQAQVPVDRLNQDAATSTLGVQQRALDAQDAALLARALGQLQQADAARKAPGQRASNAVRGDILANVQDVQLGGLSSRIPKMEFSGGLRPGLLSGSSRQLGREISRQALVDQLKGDPMPFSNLPAADYSKILNAKPIPGGTALPEGSKMDSILQAIGQYGGLAAGVAGAYGGGQRPAGAPSAPTAGGTGVVMNAVPWGNVAGPSAPPKPVQAGFPTNPYEVA